MTGKGMVYFLVEKELDDWDPIGILQDYKPINYQEGVKGEYTNYVLPILKTYLGNFPMAEFLEYLGEYLIGKPGEEGLAKIEQVANKIVKELANFNKDELKVIAEDTAGNFL